MWPCGNLKCIGRLRSGPSLAMTSFENFFGPQSPLLCNADKMIP